MCLSLYPFTYFADSKSSKESIYIYDGTANPSLPPSIFFPISSNSPSYCSYKSPCVVGNHGESVASASPEAIDSNKIAGSSGVSVTLNPCCSNIILAMFAVNNASSQVVAANSMAVPSTAFTPSVHSATVSSFSSSHCCATTSISNCSSSAFKRASSTSEISQLNRSISV